MKKTNCYLLFSIILLWTLSSCVSQNKYKEAQERNNAIRMENDSLRNLAKENTIPSEYDAETSRISQASTEEDLTVLQERYDNLKQYNNDILKRYDDLLLQNKSLLNSSSSDVQQMQANISQLQTDNDQKARTILRLQGQIDALKSDLATAEYEASTGENSTTVVAAEPVVETRTIVTNDCSNYERQVNELNYQLSQQQNRLNSLRSNVNQALLGFQASDLSVTESKGKIYVSLSQNLLFASASDKIDWKGKKAVRSLAQVLNQNPDINITVEGHTDSDGSAASNWNLSSRRALAVVNILTAAGVEPGRITASGRSFYAPVASNATKAGKAKNRRTEIILTPKLDRLYQIINQ